MPEEFAEAKKDQPHGDPEASGGHVLSGCIDTKVRAYEAAGMNPVTALSRAEEDCQESPSTSEDAVASPDNKALDEKPRVKKSWRQKVDSRLKEWGLLPSEDDVQTSFKVVGNHWLLTWTNNFKDRDDEIFPEKEIDAYIARVDIGIVPKPELMIWHAGKAFRVGAAEQIAGHGHFGIAAGVFDTTDAGQAARDYYTIPAHAKDTTISHGFTFPQKEFDGKHYKQFNTFEISLLPRGAEANLYTSLEGVKAMKIDERKKPYFEEIFGKDLFAKMLTNLDEKGKALEELGAEYKDFTGADLTVTDTKALEASFKELIPDLIEGSAEAVTSSLEAVKLVKAMKQRLDNQDAELASVRQALAMRPRASQSPSTVVNPEKAAGIKEAMDQQSKKFDEFWQVPLKKSPNGAGGQ